MGIIIVLICLLALQFNLICIVSTNHVPETNYVYTRRGDLMLGGLFPLHDEDCKTLRELETLHRLEAMVYAIELINNMTGAKDILPNISIGFEIYDTCSTEAVSLSTALRFVRYFDIQDWHCTVVGLDDSVNGSAFARNPVLGVIGTESSSTTIVVDQMYSIFHMPLLSYFATSDDLSDLARFPYFLRVVPPDSLQVQAIVDLLSYFNWKYVSFVYSDDSYGRNAIKGFKKLIKDLPICLAWEFEVSSVSPSTYFDYMIDTIRENENSRVVILFVSISDANKFFAAMNRTDTIGELQLIGSDGWGMSITEIQPEHLPATYGALKTHLADEIILNYEKYFKKLNVTNRKSNPWFSEFWYEYLNCSHRVSDVACLKAYRIGFSEESGVSRVMDSVLVYARAMDALLRDKCPGLRPLCVRVARNINNTELFAYMKRSNFTGYTGHISFDTLGDMKGIYEIENIHCQQRHNCWLEHVGDWDSLKQQGGRLTIHKHKMVWGVNNTNNDVPQSYCSNGCEKGQATIHHGDGCCWSCSNCSRNSITIINQTLCLDCGDLYAPNIARNECIKIIPTFTEWDDPWAVAIVSIDCVGLICASAVFCGYVINNNHPLIKASSRELSYLMLTGVFLSYLLVFSLIAKPSYATCYIIRIGYMLCFTITYAPILTRANRIYRIFKAGKKSTKRPGCISPHSQVIIAFSLIMVQCGINIVFLWKTPPHPDEQPVDGNVELTCKTDHVEFIVSLSYNLTLIVLCSIHAFMTRKVPTNYNESRFISLNVYTTLVIWLAFITCYFIVPYSHLQVVVMSAAMMVSATVSLVFMYVPKLYAIYFVQEVDVHAGTYRESRSVDESMTERPSLFGGNFKLPIRGAAVAPAATQATHNSDTVTEEVCDNSDIQVGKEQNLTQGKESQEKENNS